MGCKTLGMYGVLQIVIRCHICGDNCPVYQESDTRVGCDGSHSESQNLGIDIKLEVRLKQYNDDDDKQKQLSQHEMVDQGTQGELSSRLL